MKDERSGWFLAMSVFTHHPKRRHGDMLRAGVGQPWCGACAFTLIELLVVIVIVTILASMLLPALSRARTSARFTACVNNFRQVGVGVTLYTGDFDDNYPYRQGRNGIQSWSTTYTVKSLAWGNDRSTLAPYLPLETLTCPLSPTPDGYSLADSTSDYIITNTEMWFGGFMDYGQPSSGMHRLGQRPEWNGQAFNVLASSPDRGSVYAGWALVTAHRPRDGAFTAYSSNSAYLYLHCWTSEVRWRGPMDRNFLHDDGSVKTIRGLDYRDSRLVVVPSAPGTTVATQSTQLPAM